MVFGRFGIMAILVFLFCLVGCNDDDNKETVRAAKNVIFMISDGASDGTWDVASYWESGAPANEVYPYSELPVRFGVSTYIADDELGTDDCNDVPLDMDWNAAEVHSEVAGEWIDGSDSFPFEGYYASDQNAPDSGGAGTTMATGTKTYAGRIGTNHCGQAMTSVTEIAKATGRNTGVVTSVNLSHATPAAFSTHNWSRYDYALLSHQMLQDGSVDLIIGGGHPMYDEDGQVREADYEWFSQMTWEQLVNEQLFPQDSSVAWNLIENKDDFELYAQEEGVPDDVLSAPLVGVFQSGSTLQQARSNCVEGSNEFETPFECPMLENVPTLETISKMSLNYLSNKNDNGFFLMIEGGAVDWAAHSNQTARLIEEQVDFQDSVAAVVEWIEENSSWDETLLIVTTDHGNSFVLGAQSDQIAFQKVVNPGEGVVPEIKWYTGSHTSELVRMYAKGPGSELFQDYIAGTDEKYPELRNHIGAPSEYIDNTSYFPVIKTVLEAD